MLVALLVVLAAAHVFLVATIERQVRPTNASARQLQAPGTGTEH
jgi:hypothetical protein